MSTASSRTTSDGGGHRPADFRIALLLRSMPDRLFIIITALPSPHPPRPSSPSSIGLLALDSGGKSPSVRLGAPALIATVGARDSDIEGCGAAIFCDAERIKEE